MKKHTSRRDVLKTGGGIAGAVGLTGLAGCTSLLGSDGVAVSSKRFTEQEVLGYLAYEVLDENTDIELTDEIGLGGTTQNHEALVNQEIDLYWEYTGTAWMTLPPQHDDPIRDSDELYNAVIEEFDAEHDVAVLEKAPLNNTFVMMSNPSWHDEESVETMTDWASYANDGNTDTALVMTAEFEDRNDGWEGLTSYYEFDDEAFDALSENIDIVDDGVVYQILGEEEADVGVGYNTDPRILSQDLTVLTDDEDYFPAYNAAPFVHNDVLDDHPEIADVLDEVAPTLSNEAIRELNNEVANEGRSAREVASEYLEAEGLI